MRQFLSRGTALAGSFTFLAFVIVLYGLSVHSLAPEFHDGQYRFTDERNWKSFSMPLSFTSNEKEVEARFSMNVQDFHATSFSLRADDCVQRVWVNGTELIDRRIPFCDYTNGQTFSFARFLRPGENQIRVIVKNSGGPGGFDISVAGSDPLLFFLRILLLTSITCSAILAMVALRLTKWEASLWSGFTAGMIMRLIYLFGTSHATRGHDVDGHIEYIQYIAQHLSLPGIRDGWEFYQPPLYYIFSGLWVRAGLALGRDLPSLLRDLQWHGLLLSVATLGICVWIASMIFSRKGEEPLRAFFVWIMAFFPGLVFFSARINNDNFLQFWEFLAFALILRWWQKGRVEDWLLAITAIILAMLSKSNAILLLPVAFMALLLKEGWTMRKKVITGILSLMVILACTTWNFTLRKGATGDHPLMPNVSNLNSSLKVDSSPESLTEFNPVRLVLHPYNNAWVNELGRNNFWEYFYKSAFSGEFDLGPRLQMLSSVLLFFSLLLFPAILTGLWSAMIGQWKRTFLLWFSFFILVGGHIGFRQMNPYSSCQDFRYSILLLIPLTAFLLITLNRFSRTPRILFESLLFTFIGLCGVFLLSLVLM
ncbi:MAG: glycosyltransferase family 39 protein [Candidatus Peribacteraceae bacterium]|nr:glycosyltransferase family 39 protein [Candidatus Peribacteraceae bacterium]